MGHDPVKVLGHLQGHLDAALPIMRGCTIPLFEAVPSSESIDLNGTGLCLRIGSRFFVLTAKHVFDAFEGKTPVLPCRDKGGVFQPPKVDWVHLNDPQADLCWYELSPEIAGDMGITFLTLDQVSMAEAPIRGNYFGVHGYPASKAKYSYSVRRMDIEYLAQGAFLHTEPDKIPKYDPEFHLAINFDRERAWPQEGKQIIAPDPHGCSGGGLWRILRPVSRRGHPFFNTPKLVGVLTDWWDRGRALVGTQIRYATALMKKNYPDLAAIIQRHEVEQEAFVREGTVTDDPRLPTYMEPVPVARRNDPCPCGSGKKYKKCHGF